jgi:hypothetical protein
LTSAVWQTTPQNYLEKIFQIPFSLKPMTLRGYSTFIEALLLPKQGQESLIVTRKSEVSPANKSLSPEPPNLVPNPSGSGPLPYSPEPHPQPTVVPEDLKPAFTIHEESLTVKPWEAEFAERLFSLIPTPRAAKRFSNVYRILKAPLRRDRLRVFEGTPELPGEFQVPMLLLAILIGAPEEALEVFPLWQTALLQRRPADSFQLLKGGAVSSDRMRILQEKLRPIVSDPNFPQAPALFAEWIPRVSRFSFDVGRSVESTRYARAAEAAGASK